MPCCTISILINVPLRALVLVQHVRLLHFVILSQVDILVITKKDHTLFHDLMVLGGVTSRPTPTLFLILIFKKFMILFGLTDSSCGPWAGHTARGKATPLSSRAGLSCTWRYIQCCPTRGRHDQAILWKHWSSFYCKEQLSQPHGCSRVIHPGGTRGGLANDVFLCFITWEIPIYDWIEHIVEENWDLPLWKRQMIFRNLSIKLTSAWSALWRWSLQFEKSLRRT